MRLLSLWIAKACFILLRLLHRRGATLPGLLAERVYPAFLPAMLEQLSQGVIVVSGTNGKTTSTKMLSSVVSATGMRVLTNPTGSNFTRGIAAAIAAKASWNGNLPYDIAIIELDEAYAAKFVTQVAPRACVILNIMRDQMDRFGEIDYTAILLRKVVAATTEFVVLNRDDPRVYDLRSDAKAEVILFGVAQQLRNVFRNDDELHGDIEHVTEPALVELRSMRDETISLRIDKKVYTVPLSLYGVYNAQNATAVIAALYAIGLNAKDITTHISAVKPAFGRGERIAFQTKRIILQLVKNPGGFRHALLGATLADAAYTLIAINDDYADGRDVSWLWDVDFSSLNSDSIVATTGVRAADMALRLQYDDIRVADCETDLKTALETALLQTPENGTLQIYTTYTAMLKLRDLLGSVTKVEQI